MRPNPASWAAFARRMSRLLSHGTRQSARVSKPHSPRNTRFSTHPADRSSPAWRRAPRSAVIAQAGGSVLPVRRTLRRPQRPVFPTTRHDASAMTHLRKPSSGSPSRTTGTASLVAICGSALKAPHECTGGTLLQEENPCNRKLTPDCAEAVEDRDCLWKGEENTEKSPTDFTDQHGSKPILEPDMPARSRAQSFSATL